MVYRNRCVEMCDEFLIPAEMRFGKYARNGAAVHRYRIIPLDRKGTAPDHTNTSTGRRFKKAVLTTALGSYIYMLSLSEGCAWHRRTGEEAVRGEPNKDTLW